MSLDWRLRAACVDVDPFSMPEAEFVASGTCSGCPVKTECLAADPCGEELGVYGGLTKRQRMSTVKPADRRLAPHGTEAAYQRHVRLKESACQPCRDAHTVAYRERRQRLPPKKRIRRRPDPRCGTTAGYRHHLHAKEVTCDRCRRAWADYVARRAA